MADGAGGNESGLDRLIGQGVESGRARGGQMIVVVGLELEIDDGITLAQHTLALAPSLKPVE